MIANDNVRGLLEVAHVDDAAGIAPRLMSYPGGKGGQGTFQKLIGMIPLHDTYIELFLGSGALMRYKRPARRNVGVDVDRSVLERYASTFPPGVDLLCMDALEFLRGNVWHGGEFVYLDPPYLFSVRCRPERRYDHELGEVSQHQELLEEILRVPVPVMISGYWSELYSMMLDGWRTFHFANRTRGGSRTEWVWMNYPEPAILHDSRYVGMNYRARERFKRFQSRLPSKLFA